MKSIYDFLINYGPSTVTAGIALFYLKKDWKSFRKGILRWAVLFLICILWVLGVLNIYSTDEKNDRKRTEDKMQIGELTSAVKTAKETQEDNTKQFIIAFGKLSEKVSKLQGAVKTAGLKEEAKNLQAELQATQKTLKPKKATLSFSFVDTSGSYGPDDIIREVTLPVKDNVVHVEYKMLNKTDVVANTLEIILFICAECEFAAEPIGAKDFAGRPRIQRNIVADFGMYPMTSSKNLSVDIKVPPHATRVAFGVDYRCAACEVQKIKENTGYINLKR